MNSYLNNFSKNRIVILVNALIVFSLLLFLSLGQTARWDILDHLQMADRFEKYGNIYPNYNDEILTGASVYFPGVSFLTILVKKILPDSLLLITMQLLACICIVIFFFIQNYITKSFKNKMLFSSFYFATTIAFLFLNFDWLIYASEFKPDIISYCVGAIGIIISGIDKNKPTSKLQFILGALITGIAIIFKQQYIFFLFGLISFAILRKDKKTYFFVFLALLVSMVIIFILRVNNNVWFWTVKVLQDDGLVSIKSWIIDHQIIARDYTFSIAIIIALKLFQQITFPPNIIDDFKKNVTNNIWLLIMTFVFIGAFLSSFKVGGNSGNTAFGLIVLLPVFLYFIQNIKKSQLCIFYIIVILIKSPTIINTSQKKITDTFNFSAKTKEIIKSDNAKILTGSDVYYSSRNFRKSNKLVNYWMYSLRNNTDIYKQLELSADKMLFDYLIVENWPENRKYLLRTNRYKILYENSVGIIATSRF